LYWLGVKLLKGLLNEDWVISQWEVYELDQSVNYKESLSAIVDWMTTHEESEVRCRTSLLIVPGYRFKVPTGLVTNFHQPGSTLLLLVAAFVGDNWKKIYKHALENDYRFLSYGDSSYLTLNR
jgi:S-adenosylmethionine:tRNA ribosyltransferase-isomerase